MVGLFNEDKQEICKKLYELLKITRGGNHLLSIEYVKDGSEEYAELYWQNDWQKDHPNHKGFLQKICITGDSGIAIIQDVVQKI